MRGIFCIGERLCWRVAILNDAPKFWRETMPYFERHNETDEVFVLLEGACTLCIGYDDQSPEKIELFVMEKNKPYNVKRGVWHNLTAVPGTMLLIVENTDTSEINSNYFPVTLEMLS